MRGEFEPAEADYRAALDAARADGDRGAEWQGLLDLGFAWLARDYARAGIFFEQALTLAEELGDVAPDRPQPEPSWATGTSTSTSRAAGSSFTNAHWPPFVNWVTLLASHRRWTSSASRC